MPLSWGAEIMNKIMGNDNQCLSIEICFTLIQLIQASNNLMQSISVLCASLQEANITVYI